MRTNSFHEKTNLTFGLRKKINFGAKKKTFYDICFVFLHRPHEISVFRATLGTHRDVHVKFFYT
jgi:hypothetical protein